MGGKLNSQFVHNGKLSWVKPLLGVVYYLIAFNVNLLLILSYYNQKVTYSHKIR